MHTRLRSIGFMIVGAVAGVLISLNFQAIADRATRTSLPIEELRAFTEVFGAIKTNYVEPVEDKKLITEAINGMLTGLDPHSSYLDAEAFRELQVGTQGQFGGLGIEVGMEDGFVKVISPIEDTPGAQGRHQAGRPDHQARRHAGEGHDAERRREEDARQAEHRDHAHHHAQGRDRAGRSSRITRAVIRVQSVKSKMIEPGFAWVRISQFQEATAEHLVKHLDRPVQARAR